MKRRINIVGAAILLTGALLLDGATNPSQAQDHKSSMPQYISIGTAGTGGSFYPVGVGIAKLLSEKIPGVQATAEQTGGSNENMSLLDRREITVGMVAAKNASDGLNGRPPFKHKINVVLAWHLFDTPIHVIALKKSGIKTIADLRGKRVAIGPPGSGVNPIAVQMLKAYGIGENEFRPAYIGGPEAMDALGDGIVDAAMVASAIPSGAVEGLAAKHDIVLVTADEATIKAMPPGSYTPLVVPAGTYKGQDRDVVLFNTPAYAWVAPDENEELVYEMTKTVMENKPFLETVHPRSKEISIVSQAEAKALGARVHPGAIRYAKEVGKW